MLNRDKNPEYYRSSKDLFSDFYKKNSHKNLMKTNSACVGSLALESNFSDWFKEKEIPAVDMESSIGADIGDESLKKKTSTMNFF